MVSGTAGLVGYPSDVRLTDETRSYFVCYSSKRTGSTYGNNIRAGEAAAEEDWRVRQVSWHGQRACGSQSRGQAEEPARPSLLSGAKEDDLDLEVARRAHQG